MPTKYYLIANKIEYKLLNLHAHANSALNYWHNQKSFKYRWKDLFVPVLNEFQDLKLVDIIYSWKV